jgi:hypothetical protein
LKAKFKNISIEEPKLWRLFKFNMTDDTVVTDTTFRNLRLATPPRHKSQMSGRVELSFENMTIGGEAVRDARSAGFAPQDAGMARFSTN